MEHNNELWQCPYTDEKYGPEKGASWKYFQEFIKCPTPRSLKHFHEVLSNNLSDMGRKKIPSYKTIREYSAQWKWFMRAEAYDNYIRDVEDEEMKKLIKDIRTNALQAMNDRIQFQNKLREQIENDTEMGTNQKVYGANKNSEALRNEIASFNDLVNEGKTKLDAEVESTGETNINVTGSLSVEERLEKYETYFKTLNTETESDTS